MHFSVINLIVIWQMSTFAYMSNSIFQNAVLCVAWWTKMPKIARESRLPLENVTLDALIGKRQFLPMDIQYPGTLKSMLVWQRELTEDIYRRLPLYYYRTKITSITCRHINVCSMRYRSLLYNLSNCLTYRPYRIYSSCILCTYEWFIVLGIQ